ncbi:MAG TPA: hypothetical protein PKE39_10115 [Ignavibacteria bacterium]|nr:hypothetical protein [Ignavibacteria bacterium]
MEILNIIRISAEIMMFVLISAACIYVIVNIRKFNSSVNSITSSISEMDKGLKPVLNDIGTLTAKLNAVADSAGRISDNAENISGKILDKTEEAELYINLVRDKTFSGIKNIFNLSRAVKKGFGTFYSKLN